MFEKFYIRWNGNEFRIINLKTYILKSKLLYNCSNNCWNYGCKFFEKGKHIINKFIIIMIPYIYSSYTQWIIWILKLNKFTFATCKQCEKNKINLNKTYVGLPVLGCDFEFTLYIIIILWHIYINLKLQFNLGKIVYSDIF